MFQNSPTKTSSVSAKPAVKRPADLQEKKLFFLRWLLINRPAFKRGLIIFLFVVSAVFWIWALVNLGNWLLTMKQFNQNMAALTDWQVDFLAWKQKNTPQPLKIDPTSFVTDDQQAYDLTAVVTNPNANWYISELEYQFVWDGGASRSASTYFLPGEKKHLLMLEEAIKGFAGSAQLKIISTAWQRVGPADNFPAVTDHDFTLTAPEYQTGDNGKLVVMSFEISNDSPFGFWNAPINIILSRGGTVVGLQTFALDKFLAGQTRQVAINWPGDLPTPDQAELELDINFFDREVYIPF